MAQPRFKMLSKYCGDLLHKTAWLSSPEPLPMEPMMTALSGQLSLLVTALTRSRRGILPRLSRECTGHSSWGDRWFCVLTVGLTGQVWQACAEPASSWLNLAGIRIPLARMESLSWTERGFSSAGGLVTALLDAAVRGTTVLR